MKTFLQDYGQFFSLLSITVIPVMIWWLGVKFQDRKSKRDAKLSLFLQLLANRKAYPVNKDWEDALNQIDVVFQDNPSVRSAWRAYYDALNPDSPHMKERNSFQLDLFSEIANVLGYTNLKQTDMDRFYTSIGVSSEGEVKQNINFELLKTLQNINKAYEGTSSPQQ